jgi:beta-lactamase class A
MLHVACALWLAAAPRTVSPHGSAAGAALRPDSTLAALERTIARIAGEAGGTVGVAALHVESGQRVALNADRPFPMQSVYKLPIAIGFLRRVDAGEARLDQEVPVGPDDLRPAYSPLAERHPRGGFRISAGELLERTVRSDNTASDLLLELAGGPAAVTRTLRQAGIEGIRIDRSEGRIAFDYHGIAYREDAPDLSRATFESRLPAVPPDRRSAAAARYRDDPRDRATPAAMVDLLVRLDRGELLTPASTARLRDLLQRVSPVDTRLKGDLPPDTPVAHKSGTSNETDGILDAVNDVGLVTLPAEAGHVAIAVFVAGSDRGKPAIESAIARISRAVYDHWSARGAASVDGGARGSRPSGADREQLETIAKGGRP